MARGKLKNPGRYLLVIVLLLCAAAAEPADQLQTVLQDSTITVGESTILKVKLSGGSTSAKPVDYPNVPGLEISYSGMQRSFEYINGKSWSGVTITFTITAMKEGKYTIPPFSFKDGDTVLQSRRVSLLVTQGADQAPEGNGPGQIQSLIEISGKNAYAGQPLVMRYYILSSGAGVQLDGFEKPPGMKGFINRQINEDVGSEVVTKGGIDYVKSHVATFTLVPTAPGSYRVGGGTAVISTEERRGGSPFSPFSMFPFRTQRRLYFNDKLISVKPVPDTNKPENFKGDIGAYTMSVSYPDEPVELYSEKRIEVTLKGTGNILTLSKPEPEFDPPGVKILSEEGGADYSLKDGGLAGYKTFIFTVVPEEAGSCDLGRFTLSFFNPAKGAYETIESEPVVFQATGDAEKNRMEFDNDGSDTVDFNIFYIAAVLVLLAGAVSLVVIWERRRMRIVAGEDNIEVDCEEDETVEIDQELPLLMENLRNPVHGENFINTANRILNLLEKKAMAKGNPDDVRVEIEKIREEIYGYKFGGRRISESEMKQVFSDINELYRKESRTRR